MLALVAVALLALDGDWPTYGNDPGGMRYSPLTQISRGNVKELKQAWSYRHGDMATENGQPKSSFECTPIEVDGTLFFSTPFSRVIALDAVTGAEKWTFDPKIARRHPFAWEPLVHRGVATWQDTKTNARRIYIGTYSGRLYALDAKDGKPCLDFGEDGFVDLKKGLRKVSSATYQCTQPPTVVGDVIVMGSTIGDNNAADAGDGSIRGFDVRTGQRLWSLDPAPKGSGAANAWAVMSADPETGVVFVPTSSPSPDYYGALRPGIDGHANSLVALDAKAGIVKWSYQVVHHDLWDYDIPAEPILCTVKGKPAVIALTKMGLVFALDRRSGKPIFPVNEKPVPRSTVPNEKASTTQPFPSLPKPLVPVTFELWTRDADSRAFAKESVAELRGGQIFAPPRIGGIIENPGTLGGCNWSGGAFDPINQTLFTNVNNLPMKVYLIPQKDLGAFQQSHPGVSTNVVEGTPYALGRAPIFTREQLPACKPPWGKLCAVDMTTGKLKWEVPLGRMPQVKDLDQAKKWGSISLGGCIVTKSGLVFIAGACDGTLRAFDADTGRVLWAVDLPAGGNATPMTYSVGGKQFLVICAGGHSGLHTKIGDYVIAYALP